MSFTTVWLTLARNVNEYFGIQETKHMLDQLEAKFPDLLKVLRHATVQRISEVLQRLLSERVSVRNMKLVWKRFRIVGAKRKKMSLTLWSIRGAMARYICHKFLMAANYEQ